MRNDAARKALRQVLNAGHWTRVAERGWPIKAFKKCEWPGRKCLERLARCDSAALDARCRQMRSRSARRHLSAPTPSGCGQLKGLCWTRWWLGRRKRPHTETPRLRSPRTSCCVQKCVAAQAPTDALSCAHAHASRATATVTTPEPRFEVEEVLVRRRKSGSEARHVLALACAVRCTLLCCAVAMAGA
jgi:hypothetical protein